MLLLVNGATATVKRYANSPYLGWLATPRHIHQPKETDIPFAADNDAFNGFDPLRFIQMLEKLQGYSCLWVSCPDVVGDAVATLELFKYWQPIIKSYDLPVALVAQDGIEGLKIPWDKFDALFLGGSTKFKLSETTYALVQEAKYQGKWVHMGRVNSIRRLEIARRWGCDSVDGTSFSRFGDTYIPNALSFLGSELQEVLF